MKMTVTARNVELSDRLRSQIDRKLRRLDRIAHEDAEASVELIGHASRSGDEANVAEVTLVSNGSVLRSASSGPTPIAAMDRLIGKLERQLVRARQRPRSVRVRRADQVHGVIAPVLVERAEAVTRISAAGGRPRAAVVKVKRFDMVPMFEEDAIGRMEELGHAFFVFLNAETDGVCVVYRRGGGGYGLIEPVVRSETRR